MRLSMLCFVLGMVSIACGSAPPSPETAKGTYASEQTACVVVYATAAEIDACRATVRRLWGQPERATLGAGHPVAGSGDAGALYRDGGF